MLRKLIERQQQQFLQQGGIREQMYNARVSYRGRDCRTGGTGRTIGMSRMGSDRSDESNESEGR